MSIDTIKALQEQENKCTLLIDNIDQTHKKTLEVMIKLRKEIHSLQKQKKKYPESNNIVQRINECDQLLEKSVDMLDKMNEELTKIKNEKEAIDQLIKECGNCLSNGVNLRN